MAATLALRQALISSGLTVEGSLDTNQSITLTDSVAYSVQDKTIADDFGEDVLWATGDGGLDSYTHGFIYSDQDVWVQLKVTETDPDEFVLLFIPANILAFIPGEVAGTDSDAFGGSALAAGTDYGTVTLLEVMRDAADGAGDASVNLYLFA